MTATALSAGEARRIALAAQGFDRPRLPGRVHRTHVRRALRRLAVLQLDYVNVLGPSHYHVLFSRLGPYRRELLHDLTYRRREFTEQWAHEASIVPVDAWPLLAHRRSAFCVRPRGFGTLLARHPDYAAWVVKEIQRRGPLAADQLDGPSGVARRIEGAWIGTVPRAMLETHFGRGRLAVADRRPTFVRVFDLAERVVPRTLRSRRITRASAQRELLRRAASAHGIGTAADLADYFRMSLRDSRPRLAELVDAGDLREVSVAGWREPAFLARGARRPPRVAARALLSPFDPVVWYRPRLARLFGFDFRLEIFVPAAKRQWGYYVLPFLLDDRLVARVDLNADRRARCLRVLAAYAESGVSRAKVAHALAIELRAVATWHGLEVVTVGRRGNLARALTVALRGAGVE